MEKKLEKDIQNEIFDVLVRAQVFFWRSNNIPVYGKNNAGKYMYRRLPKHTPRGLPDIIILNKGRFIGIEVKREGAKLRPEQAQFGLDVIRNDCIYEVVHSKEEMEKVIEELDIN